MPDVIQAIRFFLQGVPTEVPIWMLILEAAHFDPLRAQEMEAELSERWWKNYLAYRHEASAVQRQQEIKQRYGS